MSLLTDALCKQTSIHRKIFEIDEIKVTRWLASRVYVRIRHSVVYAIPCMQIMYWTVALDIDLTMTLSLPEIKQLIAYRPTLYYATYFVGPVSLYNAEAFLGIHKAPDTPSIAD